MLLALVTGCSGEPEPSSPAVDARRATAPAAAATSSIFADLANRVEASADLPADRTSGPPVRFTDVASDAGLQFTYLNGARGRQLMVEATGGGCGWLDYDRDGHWDLYFVQGGDPARAASQSDPGDELFRNVGGAAFQAVGSFLHVENRAYGQGVAIADFDNDGFDDVFVTNVGCNRLFQNCGDGTFQDATEAAGLADDLWSTSAAWGDVDRDGDLDLYVCNYCEYDPLRPKHCRNPQGHPSICHPKEVSPVPDEFYLNLGDGRFEPSARRLGLYGEGNRALGVVIADMNNDSWPDVYVANDTTPNFLFINRDGRGFTEESVPLGCAVNSDGNPQASMGIACGDYDRNGLLDLYITHFSNEWNTLYTNQGPQGFFDRTGLVGLSVPTMPMLAFGTVMSDFNADGRMELFVANGHIDERRATGNGYAMVQQLFTYDGVRWRDAAADAGEYFQRRLVGRGVATGDYDGDRRPDLAVVHQNAPMALLHNESPNEPGITLEFIGRTSNRRGIGVRVEVTDEMETWTAELAGGTSYCSSMQPALFLAPERQSDRTITVIWPSGVVQRVTPQSAGGRLVLVEPHESEEE